jgi:RNA polymerase sigma factor for flagellar operon FliA
MRHLARRHFHWTDTTREFPRLPFSAGDRVPSDTAQPPGPRETFLAELPRIERIVASISRRNGLSADDAEEFAAVVNMRLIENDYAVLRKFEGRSALATYLTVVIANIYRDFRIEKWGKWRPSAAAKRLGQVAVRLETLLYRDGYRLHEAIELLHTTGFAANGDTELKRLAAELPERYNPRKAARAVGIQVEAADRADLGLDRDEHLQAAEVARAALRDALETLPAEDRIILRLRFWDGLSVPDIARALELETKRLYRRIDAMLECIRPVLEARGVDRERALQLAAEAWP